MVRALLRDKRSDPRVNDKHLIKIAAEKGHVNIVEMLLDDGRADPGALVKACNIAFQKGYKDILTLLFKDPRINSKLNLYEQLDWATENNIPGIVKYLLKHPKIDPTANLDNTMDMAAMKGHYDIAMMLLRDGRVSQRGTQGIIISAATNGLTTFLKEFLEATGLDPSAQGNVAIQRAALNGHLDTVKMLLKDPRVDPSANQDSALKSAIEKNHIEIVKLLLKDPRVGKGDCFSVSEYVQLSIMSGFNEIFDLFFTDLTHVPYWLQIAVENNNAHVVRTLLKDPNIDPSIGNNKFIRNASTAGFWQVVEALLEDPRVDPTVVNNYSIRWAAREGHLKTVQLLLAHPKVDPTADYNRAIKLAAEHGHSQVVECLLQDDRVLRKAKNSNSLRERMKGMGIDLWALI